MNQEQLADCTGLTPVHVNHALMALDAERSRRAVLIKDWQQLTHAADFNSGYLYLAN